MSELAATLKEKRVCVLIGAGGVGKTTTAIACAVLGALQGRRVALLSIDPAKRLADALGIKLGNKLSEVVFPEALPGTLHAAMLDQKAVFDGMVRKHAPTERIAEKILVHPVYKAASSNLSGPLEYMALARLVELAEDPAFDLVVLDTPPDTHALDFLARPNILAGFMEHKVMNWLLKPFAMAGKLGLTKVMSAGERLMGGVAKVAGVTALRSFADFLILMQEVIEGFHASGEKTVRLLKSAQTSFILVTVPTRAAARSALGLARTLGELDYELTALILNRCLPAEVRRDLEGPHGAHPALEPLARRAEGEDSVRARLSRAISDRAGRPPVVVQVAEQEHDLHHAAAILDLTRQFLL